MYTSMFLFIYLLVGLGLVKFGNHSMEILGKCLAYSTVLTGIPILALLYFFGTKAP